MSDVHNPAPESTDPASVVTAPVAGGSNPSDTSSIPPGPANTEPEAAETSPAEADGEPALPPLPPPPTPGLPPLNIVSIPADLPLSPAPPIDPRLSASGTVSAPSPYVAPDLPPVPPVTLSVDAAHNPVVVLPVTAEPVKKAAAHKSNRDIIERAVWTAIQAGLGVITVEGLHLPVEYAVLVATALSAVKSFVKKQLEIPWV